MSTPFVLALLQTIWLGKKHRDGFCKRAHPFTSLPDPTQPTNIYKRANPILRYKHDDSKKHAPPYMKSLEGQLSLFNSHPKIVIFNGELRIQ